MISSVKHCAPENDNYPHLAMYIADAKHGGEKVLLCWCAGCWAGDDYALAIREVEDTQALNTRTTQEKTYHLVVSFRPEDEARLTPEIFRDIEETFAAALGYAGHQRHCGVHKNTHNMHMHIAYNMIHPETLARHEPYRDYLIRDRVCRELERKYGLTVDNGRDPEKTREGLTPGAATVEAHTGQQSFESYAKSHNAAIMATLEAAMDWQDLHDALATVGMAIKPHGNGLVVINRHGKQAIKASSLDRSLSQKKLEQRLGPYTATKSHGQTQETARYEAAPLHRSPERGHLSVEYKTGIEERKARLTIIKEQEDVALVPIKAKWEAKRREIQALRLPRRKIFGLIKLARAHEAEELAKARQPFAADKTAVKQDIPYCSWVAFLQGKACQGDEVALAILRSQGKEVVPERHPDDGVAEKTQEIRDASRRKAREILASDRLLPKSKKGLLAVLKMEELAAQDAIQGKEGVLSGMTHCIDKRGNVLFTLAGGGMVRDTGREVFFSFHDKTAQEAASRYARVKWGKNVTLDGNRIRFVRHLKMGKEKQPEIER